MNGVLRMDIVLACLPGPMLYPQSRVALARRI